MRCRFEHIEQICRGDMSANGLGDVPGGDTNLRSVKSDRLRIEILHPQDARKVSSPE